MKKITLGILSLLFNFSAVTASEKNIDVFWTAGANIGKIYETVQDSCRQFEVIANMHPEHIASEESLGEYYSASDEKRATDLYNLLKKTDTKFLWAGRGGFGSAEVLAILELMGCEFPKDKTIIGFSDVTTLLLWAHANKTPAIHGPMANFSQETYPLTAIGVGKDTSINQLMNIINGTISEVSYTLNILHKGNLTTGDIIQTTVIGGNLSVLVRNNGTDTELNPDGAIVFLEDTGEAFNRAHSLLMSMTRTWKKQESTPKALFFGDYPVANDFPLSKIIENFAKIYPQVPVFQASGFGHGSINQVLPFGTISSLTIRDTDAVLNCSAIESWYKE